MRRMLVLASVLYLFFWFLPQVVSLEPSQLQWEQIYGKEGRDVAYSVIQTNDGGYALTGETLGLSVTWEAFIIKLNIFGNIQWNKTYGRATGRGGAAQCIIQTSDNGYLLAGSYDQGGGSFDAWLIKTDQVGNVTWNKTFGSTYQNEGAYSVVEAANETYVFAGFRRSHDSDLWLLKADRYGNEMWNRTYGGMSDEGARALVCTSDGGFFLAGQGAQENASVFLVKAGEEGYPEWNQTHAVVGSDEVFSAISTSDDGYLIVGVTSMHPGGHQKAWAMKTNVFGEEIWTYTYISWRPRDGFGAFSVAETSIGGYVLAGFTHPEGANNSDIWLVKIGQDGWSQWEGSYGGTGFEGSYGARAIQANDGGFLIVGSTQEDYPELDIYIIKTDSEGVVPESLTFVLLPFLISITFIACIYARRVKARA